MTSRSAPFGTGDTPQMRVKILGGQPVMVAEDRKIPQKPNLTVEEYAKAANTPRHLAPVPDKNNLPSPTPNMKNGLSSVQNYQDVGQAALDRTAINPHPVVPPIAPVGQLSPGPVQQGPPHPVPHDITELLRQLKGGTFLPAQPVIYSPREELLLRSKINTDLRAFPPLKFREVYTELAGYDRQLTGKMNFQDLAFVLSRNMPQLNILHLRLVAAMFVAPSEIGKVNYEKLLSFLAACQKNAPEEGPTAPVAPGPTIDQVSDSQFNIFSNPGEYASFEESPRRRQVNPRENAKLLRYLEEQLSGSADPINMEKCWNTFSRADRDKRGTLSKEQIKQLTYTCGIPIQESLINAILDRCDQSNGQLRWEQYLEYINRVAPRKTGLKIPESKKPAEFVKHYPTPGADWPKGQWDNTEYGIPRNQQRAPVTIRHSQSPTQQSPVPRRSPSPSRYPARGARQEDSPHRDSPGRPPTSQISDPSSNRKAGFKTRADSEAWFKRFLNFANEVYARDGSTNGMMDLNDMLTMTDDFNRAYRLDIPNQEVDRVLGRHTKGGKVNVEAALRELGLYGL